MELATLFNDDEAVSPVIGVILMVAITVILAAVIGTFVLGQADNLNESAPSVQFEYEGSPDSAYSVVHTSGDDFDAGNVNVSYVDTNASRVSSAWGSAGNTVSAGASFSTDSDVDLDPNGDGSNELDGKVASNTEIRVLWEAAEGGSSSQIGSYQVPN